jgi:CBS-domain-containing membrane protein
MTMTLGQGYTTGDVRGYLETLSQLPRFRLVAVLDASGRFVGCASPSQLAGLMRNEPLGRGFLEAVRRGDAREVFRFPGMLMKVGPAAATNAEVLEAMTMYNLDAIAVVDQDRRMQGVVEREQLVSKLVLSLTCAADPGRT